MSAWNPYAWHTRLGRWMAHGRLRAITPLILAAIAGALLGAVFR